jgi:AcrR family transcriptional regulator
MATRARNGRPSDLREACVEEALKLVGEIGVEGLSLRDVARRLGVSHQAPYKHFPSRDHLVAELVARAFASFAKYLDARPRTGVPHEDLGEMGRSYVAYAREHPLHYRLMFGTPLPNPAEHPEMMRQARHAFALLRDSIALLPPRNDDAPRHLDLETLFVWATVHGLATILQTHALDSLGLSPADLEAALPHTLERIGGGLGLADEP